MTEAGTSGLRADLRALPRPVWLLLAGSFVNRFGSFVLPFLALYLTHRGYSVAQAGLALSAYGVGSASAAAAGGVLADHVGRRGTIALSMYSSSVVMLALSQAGSLAEIVPLTALAGVALIVGPAAGTLIYAASPDLLWGGCIALGVLAAAIMLSPAARPAYAMTASRSTSAA